MTVKWGTVRVFCLITHSTVLSISTHHFAFHLVNSLEKFKKKYDIAIMKSKHSWRIKVFIKLLSYQLFTGVSRKASEELAKKKNKKTKTHFLINSRKVLGALGTNTLQQAAGGFSKSVMSSQGQDQSILPHRWTLARIKWFQKVLSM